MGKDCEQKASCTSQAEGWSLSSWVQMKFSEASIFISNLGLGSLKSKQTFSSIDLCWNQKMARLRIEPRLPEYMPGALPLSYLALGYQSGLHIVRVESVRTPQVSLRVGQRSENWGDVTFSEESTRHVICLSRKGRRCHPKSQNTCNVGLVKWACGVVHVLSSTAASLASETWRQWNEEEGIKRTWTTCNSTAASFNTGQSASIRKKKLILFTLIPSYFLLTQNKRNKL